MTQAYRAVTTAEVSKSIIILFLHILTVQLFAQPSQLQVLDTVEGNISRGSDGKLRITLPDKNVYELKTLRRSTREDLDHLDDGDRLVATGEIQNQRKIVWVEDVEMVGIRKILGAWRDSKKKKNYLFRDFNSVTESDSKNQGQHSNYHLLPDKKDEWTLFLSGQSIKMGSILLRGKMMRIEFIDMETREVSEQFLLTPRNQ